MARQLSRRVLAAHAANRLIAGDSSVMEELAALLIEEGREREVDILVRDIEDHLSRNGQLVVTIESARAIEDSVRVCVASLFPKKTVHIREIIRPELIGGLKITTPARTLDATVLGKLKTLREAKV